jgi:hypothetical protein
MDHPHQKGDSPSPSGIDPLSTTALLLFATTSAINRSMHRFHFYYYLTTGCIHHYLSLQWDPRNRAMLDMFQQR